MSSGNSAGRRAKLPRPIGIIYAIALIVTTVLVLVPVSALLVGAFSTSIIDGDWTLQNLWALGNPGLVSTIGRTLAIGVATAVLATGFGVLLALIVFRSDIKHKTFFTAAIGISFYLPGFILALAWIELLAPGGIINALFRWILGTQRPLIQLYSSAGVVWVMMIHVVPVVFLSIRGPMLSVDPALEEAARMGGARSFTVIRAVTLPLLIFPLLSGLLLTFILAIEQFAIPALIGIPGNVQVVATQLYLLMAYTPANPSLAAMIGLVLSLLTSLTLLAQRELLRRRNLSVITGRGYRQAPFRLGRWRYLAYAVCCGFVLISLILPLFALFYTAFTKFFTPYIFRADFTLEHFRYAITSPAIWRVWVNTIIVAAVGGSIGVLLGTANAYLTLRVRPPGYRILDFLGMVPFSIPGIVVGLGYLWAFNLGPLALSGTLFAIIVSYVCRYLPYATETVGAHIVQIDKSLEEAAAAAGGSSLDVLGRIVLPLVRPAMESGWFLLFMALFRDMAVVILIYSPATAVISIYIWNYYDEANWGLASALSILSIGVLLLSGLAATFLHGKVMRRWNAASVHPSVSQSEGATVLR